MALRNGVEHIKKFEDYGTAIHDLGVCAVTYGMRPADIKSVIGQDFGYPPHEISDDIDELVDVAQDEDESILSSLPTPDPSSLPIIVPEVLQAKRKLVIEGMKADRTHFTRPYPEPAALRIEPPPAPSSLPHDEDDVSSELKLRLGITSQLGAYVLRYPSAIEQLRSNGFRAEYFGCDHAFVRDLFDITRLPADQWNRGLAELQRKYPAEHSRYLRLGEHLPALSSEEGVSAFNALVAEPGNELPAGPRTLTAGSGVHYVFRQPPGKTKFGNSKGELPGGVDVRGADGWIVGPGAVRPDGKVWREADGAPSLIDAFQSKSIPELPNWEAKEAKPNGTPPSFARRSPKANG